MRLENEIQLDFDDVLIKPKRSQLKSRKDVNLVRTYNFLHSKKQWSGIPIMAANMDTIGRFEMSDVLSQYGMITVMHKFYNLEDWIKLNVDGTMKPDQIIPSIGTSNEDYDKFKSIYDGSTTKPNFICVDVANGYGEYLVEFIKKLRNDYKDITIICGNVVSGEMVEALVFAGADIIKIGIGGGSACATRLVAGVGYPQLSAVIECADAAHGLGAHIISDGGCRTPADIVKAFAGGADFVMLGGMLAGYDQSGGDLVIERYLTNKLDDNDKQIIEEKKYKIFYGMSSDTAQKVHYGEQKEYRASEGRTVKVPYRGDVNKIIQEILGGLRSALTYVGAHELKHLSKCATFIRVVNTHNRIFEKLEL